MKPIIYPYNETAFTSRGYGALADCVSCTVTEVINGEYSLALKYPKNGINQEYLQVRNIIVCPASEIVERQAFRISKVSRSMRDYIIVTAFQLSYDLAGYPVEPFTASGVVDAISHLDDYVQVSSQLDMPFNLSTELTKSGNFTILEPSTLRSWFGGREGSLIDVYGGEWEYDFWNCVLKSKRGENNGARLSYGVNLAEYVKERTADAYTHILPYFFKESDDIGIYVLGGLVATGATNITKKVLMLNVTDKFSTDYGNNIKFEITKRHWSESEYSVRWHDIKDTRVYYLDANYKPEDYAVVTKYEVQSDNSILFAIAPNNGGIGYPVKVLPNIYHRFSCQTNDNAKQVLFSFADANGSEISTRTVSVTNNAVDTPFTTPSQTAWVVICLIPRQPTIDSTWSDIKLVSQPTAAQVRSQGTAYLNSHAELKSDSQTISVKPELIDTDVNLGDTVNVVYEDELISTRVVKATWDVLAEKYENLEIGTVKQNIAQTIKKLK